MASRREILIGAAAVAAVVAPSISRAAESASAPGEAGNFIYDYLFVEVLPGPGAPSQTAFLAHLSDTVPQNSVPGPMFPGRATL